MEFGLRYLKMLSLIPAPPQEIDAITLHRKLGDEDLEVDLRSVQRDLHRLSVLFPITCTEGTRPLRWSWAAHAPPLTAGGIGPVLALALVLADTYFTVAMPQSIRDALAPLTRAARGVLATREGTTPAELAKRFRVVPKGPAARTPEVAPAVLEAVTRALAERRKLAARYRPATGELTEYVLDPLACVQRGALLYLVAWKPGRQDRLYLLHRFESAALLDAPAEPDDTFDLDAFLARGELGFAVDDREIAFVARFDARAARVVAEAPLADDQTLEPLPGGEVRVRATLRRTHELEGWLLGFGPAVVVEGPPELAEAMAKTAHAMAARYPAPA